MTYWGKINMQGLDDQEKNKRALSKPFKACVTMCKRRTERRSAAGNGIFAGWLHILHHRLDENG
ncbi:hypothetical protein ACH95_06840 [Bacillus glycinifermentans]|uniref:Uncharacterized protein n=1 Tax=Bacillus glycinifermentans TaxID=1664069 RepID=A0A0J6E5X6_9BACI|nr:hypothetical protein COP00_19015 [Bacillus glycinifermentans]KMM61540.1 hypothetical protein ACH95_06840 [Bacillus glycinifermentans]KRT95865.1 hypothetical protein AB447_201890 [Bacillus glycinifermentans]